MKSAGNHTYQAAFQSELHSPRAADPRRTRFPPWPAACGTFPHVLQHGSPSRNSFYRSL